MNVTLASHSAIRGVHQGILERKEVYTIPHVLAKRAMALSRGLRYAYFDDDRIKIDSQRMLMFAAKGWTCCECGLKGAYFAKECYLTTQYKKHWTLYLYAINDKGEEVLMTRDHIRPRSRRGRNKLKNYAPMCTTCNNRKGSKMKEVEINE
jgi:5-methylcytosine-specific restriction endonuclease McrA